MVKLSILTPVFNGRAHIENCLRSVIAQECPSIEHIIVDGGSNDGTSDIICRYAGEYPHIRWLTEPDSGQSEALNKAVALARGEILGTLNVDDYYGEGVFKKVLNRFPDLPTPSLLVSNCNVWDSSGKLLYVNKPRRMRVKDLLLGSTINPFPVNPSAYFYHATIHSMIGYYDETDDYTLDLDFLLRVVRIAHVQYVDEVWGNFLLADGTKTQRDLKAGSLFPRQAQLMDKYRKQLPVWDQLSISFARRIYSTQLLFPVAYFSRYPEEIPWRLKQRLAKLTRPNIYR